MNTDASGFTLLMALGQVEEGFIHDASLPAKKRRHLRWVVGTACAAALALAVLTLPTGEPQSQPPADESASSSLTVNWHSAETDGAMGALLYDMDLIIEEYSQTEAGWDAVMADFRSAAGIGCDELLARLEGTFSLSRFYTRSTRQSQEGPYQVHDYCLRLTTKSGGSALLALSRLGEPLRDCLLLDEAPLVSRIGETELTISGMKTESQTCYLTRFASGGVWYDVETENVTLAELQLLLEALLLPGVEG
ncbi:MAG: hypothetical protein ACI3W8_04170 [Oscillospiraceae bacterium]